MQMADILECKFIYAYSESVFVCAHVCVGKKKKRLICTNKRPTDFTFMKTGKRFCFLQMD